MPSSKKKLRYHSEPLPSRHNSESPDSQEEDLDRHAHGRSQGQAEPPADWCASAASTSASRPPKSPNLGTPSFPLHLPPPSAWEDARPPKLELKRPLMHKSAAVRKDAQFSKDPSDRQRTAAKTHAPPDPHKMTSHRSSQSPTQSHSNTPSLPPIVRSTIPNTTDGSSSSSSASSSANTPSATRSTMPTRVDSVLMHQRLPYEAPSHHHHHYYNPRPSPPPIATLSHSPSLASDRSSDSSPAPTILPPLHPTQLTPANPYAPNPHRYTSSGYTQPPPPPSHHHTHQYYNQATVTPTDVFATPASPYAPSNQTHNYGGHYGGGYTTAHSHVQPPPAQQHHYGSDALSSSAYAASPYTMQTSMYGGGGGGYSIIYTDDAATKLSDRVRRRCYNCSTTDTSTWRRSSLHPGKVLCNKCGLFERTHGRDRPEQFPHKRGTLTTSTFPSRTPPSPTHDHQTQAQAQVQNQHQHQHQQQPQVHGQIQSQNLPPAPSHPSLATSGSLPQIGDWLNGPGGGSSSSSRSSVPNTSAGAGASTGQQHGQRSSGYDSSRHSGQSSSATGSPHLSMSQHQQHPSQSHHQHQSGSPRSGSVSGSPMMGKAHVRHQAQGGNERSSHRISTRSPSPEADMLRDSQSPRMTGLPGMPSDVGSDYSRS